MLATVVSCVVFKVIIFFTLAFSVCLRKTCCQQEGTQILLFESVSIANWPPNSTPDLIYLFFYFFLLINIFLKMSTHSNKENSSNANEVSSATNRLNNSNNQNSKQQQQQLETPPNSPDASDQGSKACCFCWCCCCSCSWLVASLKNSR